MAFVFLATNVVEPILAPDVFAKGGGRGGAGKAKAAKAKQKAAKKKSSKKAKKKSSKRKKAGKRKGNKKSKKAAKKLNKKKSKKATKAGRKAQNKKRASKKNAQAKKDKSGKKAKAKKRLSKKTSKGEKIKALQKKLKSNANRKAGYSLGSGTRAQADKLGKAFVGPGAKVSKNGKALVSKDGLRVYRSPSRKPNSSQAKTGTQANFMRLNKAGKVKNNGHLNIAD